MSSRKSRHSLMQAIVRGSLSYGSIPEYNHIDAELEELGRCSRVAPVGRQRLLQVLHATRALDTCLSAILRANNVTPKPGIGGRLHQLKNLPKGVRGYLDHSAASGFTSSIAHKRNRYAHTAAAFPSSTHEVDSIVAEVHSCLSKIL